MAFTKSRFTKRSAAPSRGPSRSFGSRPTSDRRSFDSRPRPSFERKSFSKGPLELFNATCEKCGNECQVPFKPTGGKPVYCRDCFKKTDSYESRPSAGNYEPRKSYAPRSSGPDLSEINEKLDRIMRALKID